MTEKEIRSWLLSPPKPVMVRVTLADGDTRDIPCTGPWSKIAASVDALEPAMLEAYAQDGKLLRAKRVEVERTRKLETPEIPQVLSNDPETLRLTHFANLLLRAHHHTDEAFDKLLAIVDRVENRAAAQDDRIERLERQYRRAQQDQIDDMYDRAAEAAEAAAAGGGDMLTTFLQSLNAGRAERRAAAKKPNGKGHE